MATGGENYKIQCLSKILSNELTTKPKKKKVDIILKQSFFFCIVVSGLNLACVLLRTLKTIFYTCTFFILSLLLSMCDTHFSFKWNKEILHNNNYHNDSNSHDNQMVIKRKPLT